MTDLTTVQTLEALPNPYTVFFSKVPPTQLDLTISEESIAKKKNIFVDMMASLNELSVMLGSYKEGEAILEDYLVLFINKVYQCTVFMKEHNNLINWDVHISALSSTSNSISELLAKNPVNFVDIFCPLLYIRNVLGRDLVAIQKYLQTQPVSKAENTKEAFNKCNAESFEVVFKTIHKFAENVLATVQGNHGYNGMFTSSPKPKQLKL